MRSRFKITYCVEENQAEEWEKAKFEFVDRTEHFDLCEKCAEEIYEAINGRKPPRKII